MTSLKLFARGLVALSALMCCGLPRSGAQEDDAAQEGVEVLARGPIHEAFAGPVTLTPVEGVIVPNAPPELIQEAPPEVRPEGDPIWIPGYWAWDDDRSDFIWVSGAWRLPPAGQRWVPGYWTEAGEGYRWVNGFWTSAEMEEVNYLPQPPETLEQGPNVESPGKDSFWVPGNHVYRETRYVWSPGYWAQMQPDYVWMPAQYSWCPSGYVYTAGYWDYPVVNRGWLFAPVYFSPAVYTRPEFVYRPAACLNMSAVSLQLFVRPRWGSYYFGDYYAPNYASGGFYPWYSWHGRSGIGYDPIFVHQRWYHQSHLHERDWERNLNASFQHRRNDVSARPPHQWAAQSRLPMQQRLAMPLNQFTNQKHVQGHVQRISASERDRFTKTAGAFNQFQRQRQQAEQHRGPALGSPRGGGRDRTTASKTALKLPDVNGLGGRERVNRNVPPPPGGKAGDRGVAEPTRRGPGGATAGEANRRLRGDASRTSENRGVTGESGRNLSGANRARGDADNRLDRDLARPGRTGRGGRTAGANGLATPSTVAPGASGEQPRRSVDAGRTRLPGSTGANPGRIDAGRSDARVAQPSENMQRRNSGGFRDEVTSPGRTGGDAARIRPNAGTAPRTGQSPPLNGPRTFGRSDTGPGRLASPTSPGRSLGGARRETMRPVDRAPDRAVDRSPTRPQQRQFDRPIQRAPERQIQRAPERPTQRAQIQRQPQRQIQRDQVQPRPERQNQRPVDRGGPSDDNTRKKDKR